MSNLELREIRATSPTLAESMRACMLRAGLSRTPGSSGFVLGNPKAWLGTAYHEVLEKIVDIDLSNESLDTAVEKLWSHAIADQQRRAAAHVLDCRFGLPQRWPGYYIARASVQIRAQELNIGSKRAISPVARLADEPRRIGRIREMKFDACDGKLLGRPDVIRANEIIDYKSGAIFEYDESTQAEVVKAAYVRQLSIYGYLVKANLGWWPVRGFLLPFAGAGVEVALDPSECTREAMEAISLLNAYNQKVNTGAALKDFASPSPQACRWCAYKLICPVFWEAASPVWSGNLDGAAVEGQLADTPSAIHAGAARAISVNIQAGSEARHWAQITPLNPAPHPIVATLAAGERVRLVSLRVRPDGVLTPTQRTVLARVTDLPAVELATEGKV